MGSPASASSVAAVLLGSCDGSLLGAVTGGLGLEDSSATIFSFHNSWKQAMAVPRHGSQLFKEAPSRAPSPVSASDAQSLQQVGLSCSQGTDIMS